MRKLLSIIVLALFTINVSNAQLVPNITDTAGLRKSINANITDLKQRDPKTGTYLNKILNGINYLKANKGDSTGTAGVVSGYRAQAMIDSASPFKEYVALLTQSSTSAPTAVVQYNELGGTITWARTSAGIYTATLTGAFVANKTTFSIQNNTALANRYIIVRTSANVLTISCDNGTTAADSLLSETPFIINVRR